MASAAQNNPQDDYHDVDGVVHKGGDGSNSEQGQGGEAPESDGNGSPNERGAGGDQDGQGRQDSLEDSYDEEYDEEEDMEQSEEVPDECKTPVTVVTGFLGSGKTTLVNYILREQRDMKIAVIENEFGAVAIDDELVSANVAQRENVITMDNGCLCCTVRGDLVQTLEDFLERRKEFDCILLETTGLADPSPIVATFEQHDVMKTYYRVDSILTLVDAKHVIMQLDRVPEDGAVNEAAQQLAFADRVLLNKTDLVTPEQLQAVRERITSVNAFAEVIETQHSKVSLDKILNLSSYNLERTLELLEQQGKEEDKREEEAAKAQTCTEKGCSHDHGHHNHGHSHAHEEHNGEPHGHKDQPNGQHNGQGDHGAHHHSEQDHASGHKRKHEGGGAAEPAKRGRVVATRHDSKIGSLGLTLPGLLDVEKFNVFIRELVEDFAPDMYRTKGVLAFEGQPNKWIFHGTHEMINCQPSEHEWPEGKLPESKLVFIGRALDYAAIEANVRACMVETTPPAV